ncbi:MAG: glycosyltransferase [Vicinamibacteria bacterium]
MRILFVVGRAPYPPLRGDQVRSWHQIRMLARTHAVSVLVLEREDPAAAGALAELGVRALWSPSSAAARGLGVVRHAASALPLQAALFDLDAHRRALAGALTAGADVAHVQLVRLAPLLPALGRVPCVVDLVDALSQNLARRAERDRGPLRGLWRQEARRLRAYEAAVIARAGHSIVVSDADREALGGGPRLSTVPNGVDGARFAFDGTPRANADVVFTGNLGYFANADAAAWFAREAFPLVRARRPAARFLVAGARPSRSVRALGRLPGVVVLGPVEDMAAVLRAARVAVAPLRSGSGQQSKVLEAMACGTPVVASPLAVAGVAAVAGRDLLVAADADSTAELVLKSLTENDLCVRLAAAGRRLVEEAYTWERSAALLEAAYDRAVLA